MAAPRKYPGELRERALPLTVEARRDPATRTGALKRIGGPAQHQRRDAAQLGRAGEIDASDRPGTSTDDSARLAELEKEVRELRRANANLRSASAFFAAELDRPTR